MNLRADLQEYGADKLGEADGVLITDDTGGAPAVPVPSAGGSAVNDVTFEAEDTVLFGRSSPADAAKEWVSQMTRALEAA